MTTDMNAIPAQLAELQNRFKEYLFTPEINLVPLVEQPVQGVLKDRLDVYSDGYRLRLFEVFASNYPMMKVVLGDNDFQQLGLAYLVQHPSQYANIRYFGDQLADFLVQHNDTYHAALAELARFEWGLTIAVDAADATVVNAEMIGRLLPEEWPQIHLRFHPSLQLLWQHWNVTEVWLAAKEERPLPAWCQHEQVLPCLLWRHDNGSYFQNIDEIDAFVLTRYQADAGFELICEELLEQGLPEDEIPQRMANLLQFLLARSAISSIVLR
jgi:hypothetical protein